jgi:ribose/xylose/arabinose/galactoside ABC-type transport system permease subunit
MQRWLLTIGAVVILLGLAWPYVSKLGLGRLPGDFRIHTSNGVFYFPLTTSILLSLVLSLVLWLFRR